MKIDVRRARTTDRERILEISAQIWEGDDYIPYVIDAWMGDEQSELAVATWGGRVVGFGRRMWLVPGYAWFEGTRTEPAYQGRGVGRALTEAFVARSLDEGATRIGLGTYIDNEASIHIIESMGFERIASFVYLEKDIPAEQEDSSSHAESVCLSIEDTLAFVERSEFLDLAHRRLPHGWRFLPFDADPHGALAAASIRWGMEQEDGRLCAAVCLREASPGRIDIVFADGDQTSLARLLAQVHRRFAGHHIEAMIPHGQGRTAQLLPVLQACDYETWDNYAAAVFVYELVPERETDKGETGPVS